jgi:hypothetical protein
MALKISRSSLFEHGRELVVKMNGPLEYSAFTLCVYKKFHFSSLSSKNFFLQLENFQTIFLALSCIKSNPAFVALKRK